MAKLALMNSRDSFKLLSDCALLEEELSQKESPFQLLLHKPKDFKKALREIKSTCLTRKLSIELKTMADMCIYQGEDHKLLQQFCREITGSD